MPVDQHGRCVVSKEIGTSNLMSMRPIKWQCASECRQPSKEEIEVIGTTKSLFKMSLDEIHQGLNKIDRGCTLVQQAQAIIPDTPDNGEQPRVSELHGHPISCEMCMSTKSDSSSLNTLSYTEKISVAYVLCAQESPCSGSHR